MITKDFVLAGKAVFTLEMPAEFASKHDTPTHYTYKVTHKKASLRFPETWFVALLTGPNNEADYSYMGMLNAHDGTVRLTKKSKYTKDTMAVRLLERVLARVWANEVAEIEKTGFHLHHEGKCGRCCRTLTTPTSVKLGIGPECAKIMGIAYEESDELVAV